MYKGKSEHMQRAARAGAAHERPQVDQTVWRDWKEGLSAARPTTTIDDEIAEVIIAKKQLESEIVVVNDRIQRMQAVHHKTGKFDMNYDHAMQQKRDLVTKVREVEIAAIRLKQRAKREELDKKQRRVETKAECFKRVAKVMLADEVFKRIATAASEEYRRLYEDDE